MDAIIPVRGFADGKSRLTPPYTLDARAALIAAMLRHVVGAARASGAVRRVVVVSPDAAVRVLAEECGAETLAQQTTGLNPALDEGRDDAMRHGADALLILHADLPHLRPDDLVALVAMMPETLPAAVLAPDRHETGTNALLLAPPDALPFLFGTDSFACHRAAAIARGVAFAVFRAPGIAADVDTPDDVLQGVNSR